MRRPQHHTGIYLSRSIVHERQGRVVQPHIERRLEMPAHRRGRADRGVGPQRSRS